MMEKAICEALHAMISAVDRADDAAVLWREQARELMPAQGRAATVLRYARFEPVDGCSCVYCLRVRDTGFPKNREIPDALDDWRRVSIRPVRMVPR